MIRTPYIREIAALLGLALLLWGAARAYSWAYDNGYNAANVRAEQVIAEFAQAEAEAANRARVAELRRIQAIAEISEQHEVRIREIQAENDARVGELVAGTKRLRREIAAYATERLSRDSAAAGEYSETAQRGATLVGEAVGIGAECDATQAALIEAYEALRRPAP